MAAQTFDTRIGREFAKLIDIKKAHVTENVMNGGHSETEYAREIGRFKGLQEALELYEEAEANVKAAERS